MSDVDIADSIIRAAALSITQYSAEAASKELPWDGTLRGICFPA